MTQTTGILVFAGVLIIIAIAALVIFAILLTRRTNQRRQTDAVAGKGSIPRDPTIRREANDVEDAQGNFSRSVAEKQETKRS